MEVPIPGYSNSSGIDTQDLIKKLVEAESRPLRRMEEGIQDSVNEARLWDNLNRTMVQFEEYAKKLYGFNNPFDERAATSSDESIITARITTRGVQAETYQIIVKQTAQADSWVSDAVKKNLAVPKGIYTFFAGDEETSVSFRGGTIQQFVDEFNDKGDKNIVRMRAVQKSTNKEYTNIVIDGVKPGKKCGISLGDKARDLSRLIGLQTAGGGVSEVELNVNGGVVADIMSDAALVSTQSGVPPRVKSGGIARMKIAQNIPPKLRDADDATITITLLAEASAPPQKQPDSNSAASNTTNSEQQTAAQSLSAQLEDVTIAGVQPGFRDDNTRAQNTAETVGDTTSGGAVNETPTDTAPPQYAPSDTSAHRGMQKQFGVVFSADTQTVLYSAQDSAVAPEKTIQVQLPLSRIQDKNNIISFTVANPFPSYSFTLMGAIVESKSNQSKTLVPKNPVSRAKNAVIEFNNINIERETNTIDDVLPGVLLTLKRESDKPVNIAVEDNMEIIKDDIINFIGSYNQVMRKISIYTSARGSAQSSILDVLQFNSDDERKQAEEDLGKLSGNFSLVRLMNSLVVGIGREYPNSLDSSVKTLDSIGISSGVASGVVGGSVAGRFLDIDESKLDAALDGNVDAIAELFGSDGDGDIIADSGVAFNAVSLVDPFVTTNGIIGQKQNTLRASIQRAREEKNRYEARVENYRRKITNDFSKMDQSLSQLERVSQSLQGLPQKRDSR